MSTVDRRHLGWRAETIVLTLILFLILALPLAVGGVHAETVAFALTLASLGLFIAARDVSRRGSRMLLTPLGAWFGFLIWFVLVQCLPLPEWLGGVLSPEGMMLHRDAGVLLDSALADALHPLSLDPGASLLEALRLSLGFLIFVLVFNHVRDRPDTGETILASVATAGLLVLGVGGIQWVLGTGILLGAYEAGTGAVERFFVATFVNENHQAGFFNLCALVSLGCAQASDRPRARIFHGLVFLACLMGSLLSFSRGGIVAILAGCALFSALTWRDNQRQSRRTRLNTETWLGSLAVGITAVSALFYAFLTPELLSLPGFASEVDDVKFTSWSRVWELLQDYPLVGIGAGAFGDVFARYNDVMPGVEFTHVENILLQPFIDHGLVVGSVLVAWGGFILAPVLYRAAASRESRGAAVGLFVLGLQNLVDFSLSVSGVLVVAVAVMAVLVARDRREHPDSQGRHTRLMLSSRAWWVLATGALLLTGIALNAHSSVGDRAIDTGMESRRAQALGGAESTEFVSATWLAHAVLSRPVDSHLFHAEGVNHYLRGNVEGATRWLQAAVKRSPRTWGARLMLARIASEGGEFEAAAASYRKLLHDFPGRRLRVFGEMASRKSGTSLFLEAVPDDTESVLEAKFWLVSTGRSGWAWKLLDARTNLSPEDSGLRRALVLLLLSDERLTEQADKAVTEFMSQHPEMADGYLFQGYLFEREGSHEEALTMFREAVARDSENLDAAVAQVRGLEAIGDLEEMREAIGILRPSLASHPRLGAEIHRVMSRASLRVDRLGQAILEMKLATRLDPRRAHLHYELGQLHLKGSDRVHARQSFTMTIALDGNHPHAAKALEQLSE